MSDAPLEIRRLTYADLPQVIAIERRAFPTPWSLAMFVLELSKPGGVCLAAWRPGRLAGYAICSRFEDVWHLMNALESLRNMYGLLRGVVMISLFLTVVGLGLVALALVNRPG